MAHSEQTASRPTDANGNAPPVGSAPYTVLVDRGRHAGAAERLPEGRYRIGSSLDADLMLGDPGIAPAHVMLELTGGWARIEPLSEAVTVDGRPLAPGEFCRRRLPCVLEVGGALLSVRRPARSGRGSPPIAVVAGGLALLVGAVATYQAAVREAPGRPDAVAVDAVVVDAGAQAPDGERATASSVLDDRIRPSLPAMVTGGSGLGAAAVPGAQDPAQPRDALRQRLDAENLQQLAIDGEGARLVVHGTLPSEAMARWRDVQLWFDHAFGGAAMLTSRVRAAKPPERPALAIEAVYAGPDAYLVVGGERYPVGATVARRWLVTAIDGERVVLQDAAGERVMIDLAVAPDPSPPGSRP